MLNIGPAIVACTCCKVYVPLEINSGLSWYASLGNVAVELSVANEYHFNSFRTDRDDLALLFKRLEEQEASFTQELLKLIEGEDHLIQQSLPLGLPLVKI